MRTFLVAMVVGGMIAGTAARAQDLAPPDLLALRQLRALDAVQRPAGAEIRSNALVEAEALIWTLGPGATKSSNGTFGIDVSHYETEGCKIDWPAVASLGLRFVYVEVSHGVDDPNKFPSILKNWQQLEAMHAKGTLYRGAYHFLYPNEDLSTDATKQVSNFLGAIGAGAGKKPIELPPIVDIEPTHTPVKKGGEEYAHCPANRLTSLNEAGKSPAYYCDMWYKMANRPKDIIALAQNFAEATGRATAQSVIVYSGPGAWDQVIGANAAIARPLLQNRAIWISRYTTSGSPQKDPRWKPADWNGAWSMPALFAGVSYPGPPTYSAPDFWQFTETGTLSVNPFTCTGDDKPNQGHLDLNYIPVRDGQFEKAFGIH
jgi:GH25 family lysozyme M1 (1,4-beta-N-acetylmuramidase)